VFGYGSKIATDYKVRVGTRDYRVYCDRWDFHICWSNVGSHYIVTKGERLYWNDIVHVLQGQGGKE